MPYGAQVHEAREIAATVLVGDGRSAFRPLPGSPFALPWASRFRCDQYEQLDHASIFEPEERPVSSLLGRRARRGSGIPNEHGILMVDLLERDRDDIIVSNSSAGTITLFFSR